MSKERQPWVRFLTHIPRIGSTEITRLWEVSLEVGRVNLNLREVAWGTSLVANSQLSSMLL